MPDYNDVFERLMERANSHNEPLIGMISYSLYKQNKVNAIRDNSLTTDDLRNHHKNLTEVMLASLEDTARQSLLSFAESYLDSNKEKLFIEFVGDLEKQVQRTEAALHNDIQKATTFFKGFWPGFASSTAFFIVAGLVGFFWAFDFKDVVNYFQNNPAPHAQISSPSVPPSP